jgi:hypothetical protein
MHQAAALLKPLRVELLSLLAMPQSCPALAAALGITMQKAYYHVKILEQAGLVRKVGQRRARGVQEGIYQAAAQSYWLSPRLTQELGGPRRARRQASLGAVQRMAEDLLQDISQLARQEREPAATGLALRIELQPAQRSAFLAELTDALQGLAVKYGATGGARDSSTAFKLLLGCYEEPAAQRSEP